MLDSKDMDMLRAMMQEIVESSEARMTAKIEESEARMTVKIEESEARMTVKIEESEACMTVKIEESEARMTTKIEESEARMTTKIEESEARMTARIEERVEDTRSTLMAYLETAIEPKFRMLAEGHKMLQETLAPNTRVDRLEEEVSTLRSLVMALGVEVAELKKAP